MPPRSIAEDLPAEVKSALQRAAVDAFRALKLRDYGRVDMRLRSKEGADPESLAGWEFFLIEVNPNPHLAKNSELPLAAHAHGLSYPDLIERIVQDAMSRSLR